MSYKQFNTLLNEISQKNIYIIKSLIRLKNYENMIKFYKYKISGIVEI